jgi:hypothetical protein
MRCKVADRILGYEAKSKPIRRKGIPKRTYRKRTSKRRNKIARLYRAYESHRAQIEPLMRMRSNADGSMFYVYPAGIDGNTLDVISSMYAIKNGLHLHSLKYCCSSKCIR